MNISNTITQLVSGAENAMTSSRKALNNHNDTYDLLRGIHESGEQAMLVEASKILAEDKNISFIEASHEVSIRMSSAIETSEGQKLFSQTRKNLLQESKK